MILRKKYLLKNYLNFFLFIFLESPEAYTKNVHRNRSKLKFFDAIFCRKIKSQKLRIKILLNEKSKKKCEYIPEPCASFDTVNSIWQPHLKRRGWGHQSNLARRRNSVWYQTKFGV